MHTELTSSLSLSLPLQAAAAGHASVVSELARPDPSPGNVDADGRPRLDASGRPLPPADVLQVGIER